MRTQPGGEAVPATTSVSSGAAIPRPSLAEMPAATARRSAAACVADALLRALDARAVAVARVDGQGSLMLEGWAGIWSTALTEVMRRAPWGHPRAGGRPAYGRAGARMGARFVTVPVETMDASLTVLAVDLGEEARDRDVAVAVLQALARPLALVLHAGETGADRRLAVVAHELRRPLAPIASAVTLLRRRGADADVRELAGMLERQVRDLARLVHDLADEQPADPFDFSVRPQHIDLVLAVQEAVQVVLPLVAARRHRVVSSIEAGPLPVCADPLRLRQIVVNLLENAAKYTPVNGRLEVDVRRDGGHAVLQVRDSGLGIAPERLPWIFDDKPRDGTRTAGGGLGVGLPLVQRLVGRHGGTVLAESDGPGRGSRFTVRLPLVGECPATTGSAGAAVGAPR